MLELIQTCMASLAEAKLHTNETVTGRRMHDRTTTKDLNTQDAVHLAEGAFEGQGDEDIDAVGVYDLL